ncbi:HCLS1-associated protein X-1 [Narcine bancroftii]|uniref:HCLS1-associated protein X-1 n=1 Tax=Narcine bancroftii TaxID=1343680 RepID=UPI003831A79C
MLCDVWVYGRKAVAGVRQRVYGKRDSFYRRSVLEEDGEDEDVDDSDEAREDPFGFGFGPRGQPFGDGFSRIFRDMDDLFKGIGSWDVPMGQFEFPDVDAHPGYGGGEDGAKGHSPRDWMLKRPEGDPPNPSGEEGRGPHSRSPSRKFKDIWETLQERQDVKKDQDLDSKVTSEGLENALKPREPQIKSYYKSVSISKIVRPDGTVEERRTSRDGQGNEETTVTRIQGEQSYTTMTRRNAQGQEEQTEEMVNVDDGDPQRFEDAWDRQERRSDPGEWLTRGSLFDWLMEGLFWSRRGKLGKHEPVLIKGPAVGRVKNFKFLGINISEDSSWVSMSMDSRRRLASGCSR